MRKALAASTALLLLSACDVSFNNGGNQAAAPDANASAPAQGQPAARDAFQSNDQGQQQADDKPRPEMQLQVVLDRLGFSPGVVDGKTGMSTKNGLIGFQEANGLKVSGEYDEATRQALQQYANLPATRVVTIPEDFANQPFTKIPTEPEAKAKLDGLYYESLEEALAERFHTTPEVLKELNPQLAEYKAGAQVRVPNVGHDEIGQGAIANNGKESLLRMLGVGSDQPQASKVVVSKSDKMMRVYGEGDKVIAAFTVSTGSAKNPLPIGNWKVNGVAFNPDYGFDPKVLSNVDDSKEKQTFPPGPNSPVGVVWVDINKPHYGLHGTPDASTIGRAQSDGCVRLTNWDAVRLGLMVRPGTPVVFEE